MTTLASLPLPIAHNFEKFKEKFLTAQRFTGVTSGCKSEQMIGRRRGSLLVSPCVENRNLTQSHGERQCHCTTFI